MQVKNLSGKNWCFFLHDFVGSKHGKICFKFFGETIGYCDVFSITYLCYRKKTKLLANYQKLWIDHPMHYVTINSCSNVIKAVLSIFSPSHLRLFEQFRKCGRVSGGGGGRGCLWAENFNIIFKKKISILSKKWQRKRQENLYSASDFLRWSDEMF